MRVYVHGKDGMGWSIDSDRKELIDSYRRIGVSITSFPFLADYIHSVWWNQLAGKKSFFLTLLGKKTALTASNYIEINNPQYSQLNTFNRLKKVKGVWIVPSKKQKQELESKGYRTFYRPFTISSSFWDDIQLSEQQICTRFGIDYNHIKSKICIGSFQRDSLGTDLSLPKWQKGPERLINILKDIDKDKFILLIAGPRRHYVRSQCEKYKIPYIFVGKITDDDDVDINNIPLTEMPLLYKLCNLYMVTSSSEGGPKSIMESLAVGVSVVSTDVGLASDFLPEDQIFSDDSEYVDFVNNYILDSEFYNKINDRIGKQKEFLSGVISRESMDKNLMELCDTMNLLDKEG